MSWRVIARNDVRSMSTERGTLGLFTGFLLGFGGLAALIFYVGEPNFEGYLDLVTVGAGLLVPLAGIVLGYEAIIGERESGMAVLSLSLPHSRADMILGKLAGRTALLTGAIMSTGVVAGVGLALFYPSFDALRYLGVLVVVAAYGTVFLWLAATLSMALSTSRKVIAVAFSAYIVLVLMWSVILDLVVVVLFRFQPPREPESWATFATFVGPNTAFNYLLAELLDAGTMPAIAVDPTVEFITPAVAVLSLLGWTLIPVLLGYTSFRGSDL